jgi:hypothetical protein
MNPADRSSHGEEGSVGKYNLRVTRQPENSGLHIPTVLPTLGKDYSAWLPRQKGPVARIVKLPVPRRKKLKSLQETEKKCCSKQFIGRINLLSQACCHSNFQQFQLSGRNLGTQLGTPLWANGVNGEKGGRGCQLNSHTTHSAILQINGLYKIVRKFYHLSAYGLRVKKGTIRGLIFKCICKFNNVYSLNGIFMKLLRTNTHQNGI